MSATLHRLLATQFFNEALYRNSSGRWESQGL